MSHRGDVLGRRRAAALDAAPGPRQLRDRVGRRRRAAGALRRRVGLDGDHRARHRLRLREHPHHRGPGRRRVRPQRREDLRHLGRALRRRRRLGDPRQVPGPRGDQVVRGAEGHARHDAWSGSSTSSASGPPTPRRSASRTAGSRPRTCSARPRSTPSQGFAGAMATFDNTRPLVAAMAVGCAQAVARPDPRPARAGRRRRSTTTGPAVTPERRGREVPADGGRLGGARAC